MHPVAIRIGTFEIYWYGILFALGFIISWHLAIKRASERGINKDLMANLGIFVLLGGILGARVWYVVENWGSQFAGKNFLAIFNIREGGLVYYGGFIGASVIFFIYCFIKKLEWLQLADIFASCIPLGHMFGRIGCFLNGCCYGKFTQLPWAIKFPSFHATHGMPVHPTQLYEAASNLILFILLCYILNKRQFKGQVIALYLVGYGILRFVVEYFRGDPVTMILDIIRIGQFVSILFIIMGILIYILAYKARTYE